MIRIYNTVSAQEEIVHSLLPHVITLYVCGITPYDYAHVGHARVYVTFDVLYRLLKIYGYNVIYCRNFTDIDDKIIKKAKAIYDNPLRYADITQQYIRAFHQDMDALNCLRPTYEPHVTEHIPEIIAFIQELINTGHAYQVEGDVYFSIQSFTTYGKLSKRSIDDMRAGARVEPNEKKQNPLDFALWKAEPEGMFWNSPWGYGRPGWHIECSVLASQYLGNHIDIHAGGLDLVFPHHENEIAQSESIHGTPFARYWMHNGFVQIHHEKMSKSLGNFLTLHDIFKKFHPHVVRFYLLSHHYRAPLEFSFDDLASSAKAYSRLCRAYEKVDLHHAIDNAALLNNHIIKHMLSYIDQDLNIQGAFGLLFEHLALWASSPDAPYIKSFMMHVLGLPLEIIPEHGSVITPEIADLIAQREEARIAKDWERADAIRKQLQELGVEVKDLKT